MDVESLVIGRRGLGLSGGNQREREEREKNVRCRFGPSRNLSRWL